jgi:CRP-like cAMP-binding protein
VKIILNPGEDILQEGQEVDTIYYVVSGMLECSTSKDGKRIITGEVGAGELVGQMALISGTKCPITVRAMEKTELIPIPGEKIMAIVNNQPKWIKLMLESLSKRLNETFKRIA